MKTTKSWLAACMLAIGGIGTAAAEGGLGSPGKGSNQSGIGVIAGWFCDADKIEIVFDDKPPKMAAYGTSRNDTEEICGDTDNGFGLTWAYPLLGEGEHRVRAYADGILFADRTFSIGIIGDGSYLRGAEGSFVLEGFPDAGSEVGVTWDESTQNFTVTGSRTGVDSRSKVVGVTVNKFLGKSNPAERHDECAQDFSGAHWCNTREFLDGGKAGDPEEKLPTAWIRPSTITVIPTAQESLFVDTAGVQTLGLELNCNQWSSDDRDDGGLSLQTTKDGKRQIVIVTKCSDKLPNLCCAR